jgi:hypothetical protein
MLGRGFLNDFFVFLSGLGSLDLFRFVSFRFVLSATTAFMKLVSSLFRMVCPCAGRHLLFFVLPKKRQKKGASLGGRPKLSFHQRE